MQSGKTITKVKYSLVLISQPGKVIENNAQLNVNVKVFSSRYNYICNKTCNKHWAKFNENPQYHYLLQVDNSNIVNPFKSDSVIV